MKFIISVLQLSAFFGVLVRRTEYVVMLLKCVVVCYLSFLKAAAGIVALYFGASISCTEACWSYTALLHTVCERL